MKKFAIIMMVLIFTASIVAVAVAEDKLSLSGTMRVRGWDKENYSNFNDSDKSDDLSYFDQRLRLGVTLKATDAVSAHMRLDFAEDTWGSSNWEGSRYSSDSELQVDRAYLQIKQDMYTLKAGQLYYGTGAVVPGSSIVYDNNTTGATLTLNLPVSIDLHYSKLDENDANTDEKSLDTDDADAYVVQVTYPTDNFTVGAFYAAINDEDQVEADSPNVFGIFGSTTLAGIKLSAELDFFGGETEVPGLPDEDFIGSQLYLNAEYKFDSVLVGGDIYYAEGADTADLIAGNEVQIEGLNDFGDFLPHSYGAFVEDFQPTPGKVHDPSGDHAGVSGLSIYTKYSPMEKVTLWAQLAYLEPEEEDNTPFEDFTVVNLSAQYEFVQNATFAVMYSTTMVSVESTDTGPGTNWYFTEDDDASTIVGRLQIKF